MSGDAFGLRMIRAFARLLLWCYPREFRHRHRGDFLDVAAHRWHRELDARGRRGRATVHTGLLLCADTLGAVPGSWRGGAGRLGSDPRRPPQRAVGPRLLSGIAGAMADFRTAARFLRRRPVPAALAAGTLALGVGVSTAAFGALDRVVLNPLPFEGGERMRYLVMQHESLGWFTTPDGDLVERWRRGARTLERIETYSDRSAVRITPGGAERLEVTQISVGLPDMLGVQPLLGRMLAGTDARPDAPPVVMVTEAFWRRVLLADPEVVGTDLRLTSGPATIVGIWPSSGRFHHRLSADLIRVADRDQEFRQGSWTSVLARGRPGLGPQAIQEELTSLAAGMPDRSGRYHPAVLPAHGLLSDAYVLGLRLVFVGAVVLLIVAAINAANLLIGRAAARTRELTVRIALGGSSWRVARLLIAEAVVLTGIGALAGLGVAALTGRLYAAWDPLDVVAESGASIDGRALAFAAAASGAALLASVLAAAWLARRSVTAGTLSGSGDRTTDGSSHVRHVLVGAQTALAVVLVVGAVLTGRSVQRLASVDPGFDVDRLAMVSVSAPAARYETAEARAAFLRRVRDGLAALPQVEALTVANAPPFQTSTASGVPVLEGDDAPVTTTHPANAATQGADLRFFDVFGIPLVAGRGFEPGDPPDTVMVNESFARAHGATPGRRFRFSDDPRSRWYTIVGVVGDVVTGSLTMDWEGQPQVYFFRPGDIEDSFARFVLRVDGDPATAVSEARRLLARLDPAVPLSEAATFPELFRAQTARHRFLASLLAGLALLGTLFAVTGVYGVVSLDVARRTREMGVRVALGATAARLIRHVVRRSLSPVAFGAMGGVLVALWISPLADAVLFEVPARDPVSAACGAGLVMAAAALASLLPARRAASIDPVLTLRAE